VQSLVGVSGIPMVPVGKTLLSFGLFSERCRIACGLRLGHIGSHAM